MQGEQLTTFYNTINKQLDHLTAQSKTLAEKKEKLWQGKDINKWEMNPPAPLTAEEKKELTEDKDIALQKMLP